MLTELCSDLRYRLRALFRREAVERELDDELRFHIEHEAEKYVAAGTPRDEALRRARMALGGVERTKEESRDVRGTVLIESVMQDVRYALRVLRAKPGFTFGIVLTLSLGLGANAAMFGIVDRLMFRPPAYLHDAARVHRVYMSWTVDRQRRIDASTSVARYLDFVRWTHDFSSVAGFGRFHLAVGDGDAAREYPVAGVSASYFTLFDARPALGRFFTAQEDRMPAGTPVAVLGYAYWRTVFGGRSDVLGRQLRVGRMTFTIIGVAPERFIGIDEDEVPSMYLPLTAFAWNLRPEDHSQDYHWGWLSLAVKRAPHVSIAAANADLTAAFERSWRARSAVETRSAIPLAAARPRATVAPVQLARGPQAGPDSKVVLWVSGVALIVLLIACANVANLLLARALTREREIGLRLALGVGRGRLVRQLLTESLVLVVLGGVVGLAVAQWGGAILRGLFLPTDVATSVLTDGRTLIITLIATIVAAIVTGLAPAMQALRYDVARSLTGGARDTGARPSSARTALLVVQATLSVVLLVGAGLFVRSLFNVERLHLGYDVDPVLTVTENMRGVKLSDSGQVALESRLSDAARAIPGVIAATPASSVPFWAYEGRDLFVTGIDSVSLLGDFLLQAGNPDYFRTMGTRIVRGRAFDEHDRANAPRATVVSQGMAAALWPGQNPLGKCIRIDADTMPCTTVIGIAEDLRVRSLRSARQYTYYLPMAQYAEPTGMLLVRVSGDAADYAERVRRGMQQVMPGAAYLTATPLRAMVAPEMESWRLGATMFVSFGVLALALAAVGLYSVIAYGVAQRRREIGVRLALGASRGHVLRLVVRGGLRLVITGVLLGSAFAVWAGRWLATLLFNESPRDPVVYAAVAAVLVIVALVAMAVPAMAATRVDPNVALRAE